MCSAPNYSAVLILSNPVLDFLMQGLYRIPILLIRGSAFTKQKFKPDEMKKA